LRSAGFAGKPAFDSGLPLVQEWGGVKQEIRPGDIIGTPPGVKHWHGATVNQGMSLSAVQEHVEGKVVEWLEHVSEEEYRR
jgi:quercetin dioxygenase-like cupin family protein